MNADAHKHTHTHAQTLYFLFVFSVSFTRSLVACAVFSGAWVQPEIDNPQ